MTANSMRDPVQTDGDKYKVILENQRVRVLEYLDKPGDKTSLHSHPDFVLITLSAFKRRLISSNGSFKEREFTAGEVAFGKAQDHMGENIGETDTHVIFVELKEPSV